MIEANSGGGASGISWQVGVYWEGEAH